MGYYHIHTKMIQRYTLLLSGGMAIFEEGEYVLYEDYLTALAEKDKEIERLKQESQENYKSYRAVAKEANEMEKEIERLKNMIGASEWIQTEELKFLGETIDEHRAELKQQFEESIAVIHDQGAENLILKQNLALNAKMLARQTDLAREAETEAAKYRNALEVVQSHYDIWTPTLVKFVVDEALK